MDNDIDTPSRNGIVIDASKKVKIITDTNRLWLAPNRIKKKYERQRQKESLKKANKKASKWLKRAGYLDTDNNDTNMDNIDTVDYDNGTNINDLNNINL